MKRHNLPKVTYHQLRYTNASLLIAEDVDAVIVSSRLGHAGKSAALGTYSYVIGRAEKKAASHMDSFYARMPSVDANGEL